MGVIAKQLLEKQIDLAGLVTRAAGDVIWCKQECAELKFKTEQLRSLLRQAARASSRLSEFLILPITEETELIFNMILPLVLKDRPKGLLKRVFTIIHAAALSKVSFLLDNCIRDVSWLLCGHEFVDLLPIAGNKFILNQIDILYARWSKDRSYPSSALFFSLDGGNDLDRKLIIKEGGIRTLLKALKEGEMEEQENAALAIGILGCDPKSVEHMIHMGVCSVFATILEEGPMKVQAAVAWAVSVLVANYPKCLELFAQRNIVRLLVDHLASLTLEECSNCAIVSSSHFSYDKTKARMKEMVARALWFLAKDNSSICRSIAESRALLCFAVLLAIGPKAVQYNSAMAVMEITSVAEEDIDMRESAFNPNSPTCKAIVYQVLKIIEKADSELLIPCVKTIGNLARTLRDVKYTTIIGPLVRLFDDDSDAEVIREALIAVTKYACTDNDLHMDHSKALIKAGGVKRLTQFVHYFHFKERMMVQIPALILLCYVALHVPYSEELAQANVLGVLVWASKQSITQDEVVQELLLESMSRLELYWSRVLQGSHESRIPVEDM